MNNSRINLLRFLLGGSLLFILAFLSSCATKPGEFPDFEPDGNEEISKDELPFPTFSDPQHAKPSTQSFPEFDEELGRYSYYTPQNFRPFVRVLIGEKESSWNSIRGQQIEIYEGDPLSTHSRKVLQTSEAVTFKACGQKICLRSVKGEKAIKSPLWYRSKEGQLKSSQGEYRGLFLLSASNQRLNVINYVGLEDYIQGILPYEIGTLPDWGLEALKAQAVSARTYTLKAFKPLDQREWDLYSDTRDQVYKGTKDEYELSNFAVRNTRGLVLQYDGELAETYYHSTSGGHTANKAEVWGGAAQPYLKGQPDKDAQGKSWSAESPWDSWSYTFDLSDISKTANSRRSTLKAKPDISFSSIRSLKILNRNSSGRVNQLEVKTSSGTTIVRGDKTRWLFNPGRVSILPSSWFWLEMQGSQVKVWGKGFGHGIGLCQMGARARSKAGQNFALILEGYYPGTEISRVPF